MHNGGLPGLVTNDRKILLSNSSIMPVADFHACRKFQTGSSSTCCIHFASVVPNTLISGLD